MFLKSSSSSPQNLSSFGLDLIPQSSRFPKVAGWKNCFWARANFFLSPVKTTLVIYCVRSTGELVFRVLGFLAFLLGCTGALVPHASVQPMKLHQQSLRSVSLVAPAYRISSTLDQPVLSAIHFAVSLDNCTDARVLFSSV